MEDMEFKKIPLCGKWGRGKYTLVDGDYDGEYFSQYVWYLLKNGYVARRHPHKNTYTYLHKEVCTVPLGMVVDHIDRDKLNNRSCNLRAATWSQNAQNRMLGIRKNKSGYIGVRVRTERRARKYAAVRKGKTIGYFLTGEEAAKAYDAQAIKDVGVLARTNYH